MSSKEISKAHQSRWDPEKLYFTSHIDIKLEAISNESDNEEWLQNFSSGCANFQN